MKQMSVSGSRLGISAMSLSRSNVPFTIPSDVLIDVFSFCSRNDLDCIQLVSKRFDTIVKTSFKKYPIRAIYAVLVDKPVDLRKPYN
uniref:F-box domain-containing protein n=1 Tax=Ditylenchus dipsaci TaxID=166011 RepID=A0A915CXN0_9BILA